jgi:hypothetical protein
MSAEFRSHKVQVAIAQGSGVQGSKVPPVVVQVSLSCQMFHLFNWFDWFNSFNWFGLNQPIQPIKQMKPI